MWVRVAVLSEMQIYTFSVGKVNRRSFNELRKLSTAKSTSKRKAISHKHSISLHLSHLHWLQRNIAVTIIIMVESGDMILMYKTASTRAAVVFLSAIFLCSNEILIVCYELLRWTSQNSSKCEIWAKNKMGVRNYCCTFVGTKTPR